jgi:transposase-like protein
VSTKLVMDTTSTGRRHRSWPEALKREIVAASLKPGSSVSIVARQYDVNANQVFSWRKRYRDEVRVPAVSAAAQLIPMIVTTEANAVATQPSSLAATIEIELAGKYRVRVGSGVDVQALRRVLDVLERR